MSKSRSIFSDLSQQDKMEALRGAVCDSNLKQVKVLLTSGIDVNDLKQDSKLLHVAVDEENIKIMGLLIHYKADVNLPNQDGDTPLHLVRTADIAQKLIASNANVSALNRWNYTPLHLVRTAEIAQKLIEHNADVNAHSIKLNMPLHLARNVEIIQKLIEHNADVNAQSVTGDTPIERYLMSPFSELDCLFVYAKLVLSGQAICTKNCAINKLQTMIGCSSTESLLKQKQLAVVLQAFAGDQVESLLIPDQIQNFMQEDWQLLGCDEESGSQEDITNS